MINEDDFRLMIRGRGRDEVCSDDEIEENFGGDLEGGDLGEGGNTAESE